MYMQANSWEARSDTMPGCAAFYVRGAVEVGHPGVEVTLVERDLQDKSFALALELKLEQKDGAFPQVVTEKTVTFTKPGNHDRIPKVDIFYNGELLTSITDIQKTC